MPSNEVNIWKGLLPKQSNAFTIPEKSSVLEGNRRTFTKVHQIRPNNMAPIILPNSSKFPAPTWMGKSK